MKGIVSIERIAAARQRLAELSELSNGTPGREMQVRQAVDMLSSVLDELEAVAQDSKPEEEAAHENESRFNILAETATDGIISIDDQSTIRYVNPAAGQMFGYEPAEMLDKTGADVRLPVERQQEVVARLDSRRDERARPLACERRQADVRVEHHVTDQVHALADRLVREVSHGDLGRAEAERREPVDEEAVELLRHLRVERP